MTTDHGNKGLGRGDGSHLSVRLSCDRCHAQKLKCSVPAESSACERCTRAKLPCIFGRRMRSKRRSSNAQSMQKKKKKKSHSASGAGSPTQDRDADSDPSDSVSPPPGRMSVPTSSTPGATMHDWTAVSVPMQSYLPETSQVHTSVFTAASEVIPLQQREDDLVPTSAPEPEAAPTSASKSACVSVAGLGLDLCVGDMMESDMTVDSDSWNHAWPHIIEDLDRTWTHDRDAGGDVLPEQLSLSSHFPSWPNWPLDATTTGTTAEPRKDTQAIESGNLNERLGGTSVLVVEQRLVAWISETQQHLGNLQNGPWHTDSANSLDNYPIGTILRLSRQFGRLVGLGSFRNAATTEQLGEEVSDEGCEQDEMDEAQQEYEHEQGCEQDEEHGDDRYGICDRAGACRDFDTPTMLLVLSGYIWLVRMHNVVLGQFEKHLSREMRDKGQHDPKSPGPSQSSSTRTAASQHTVTLGKLHYWHNADLHRIHTAVSLLLAALDEVEAHVGTAGAMIRELTVKGLDGGRAQLGKRVMTVKGLIRQKMGL